MSAETILKMIEDVDPADTAKLDEIWKPISGFEGYFEVSNKGRVRSLPRTVVDSIGRRQPVIGKVLKPNITKRGYALVHLCINGKDSARQIHRLVAEAFLGKSKKSINHKDRNGLNNAVDNLEYVFHRENTNHWLQEGRTLPAGVSFQDGKFRAKIYHDGKYKHLGYHKTPELAHAAYVAAVKELGEPKYSTSSKP